MLGRLITYFRLGVLDLLRLWSATQLHVIIVAGICLPILLMLGLKRGHVTELRQALLTSPSGREMKFGSPRGKEFLTLPTVKQLEQELPGVEVIIPEVDRLATLEVISRSGEKRSVANVTVRPTREVDPLLTHLGATLPQPEEPSLILTKPVADRLGAQVGSPVQLTISRPGERKEDHASVELKVTSVIEPPASQSLLAFVHLNTLNRFLTWVQGFPVPEYRWPAGGSSAKPMYASWLVFCRSKNDFSPRELRGLELKYRILDRTSSLPASLKRLLLPDKLADLRVYQFFSVNPNLKLEDPARRDVYNASATQPDEILLPWNEPLQSSLAGQLWTLVGLALHEEARWLRGYFHPNALLPESEEEAALVYVVEAPPERRDPRLAWPLTRGQPFPFRLDLSRRRDSSRDDHLAFISPEMLAWLTAEREGSVDYDPVSGLFKYRAPDVYYNLARLYASTIDEVPALEDALKDLDCPVITDHSRIREIHKQNASLQVLVLVVGLCVFLFGVLTVVSVLHDSTDRKRGTIGILRVMGTSRTGVFLLIFLRAAIIGLLAALLCSILGSLLAYALSWKTPPDWTFLAWKPTVAVDLEPFDYLVVLAGAMLCCALGAVWPAWRASRLDPFDAIVEGRFR